MKGLLLIGGQGTRLKKFTKVLAKSLWPILDRALIDYQITQLVQAGINEIILAAGHNVEQIIVFTRHYRGPDLKLHVSVEQAPLGTAGAIRHASRFLGDEPVVVLNADILNNVDIQKLIRAHKLGGLPGTIVGYAVNDPSGFGLLQVKAPASHSSDARRMTNTTWFDQTYIPRSRVVGFIEKPKKLTEPGPYFINAGIYVMEPSLIAMIPDGRQVSIEREFFPEAIKKFGGLTMMPHRDLWMDIGTYQGYITANFKLLERLFDEAPLISEDEPDYSISDSLVYTHNSATFQGINHLSEKVIVMDGAWIEDGCSLERCIVQPMAVIGRGSSLHRCIIGPGVVIPPDSNISDEVITSDGEPEALTEIEW